MIFGVVVFFVNYTFCVQAATIKSLSRRKKLILINEGRLSGFIKGKKVCVFNSGKQVACGVVTRAKKSAAQVKINRDFLKVKKGFEVRLKEASKVFEPEFRSAIRLAALPVMIGAPADFQLIAYSGNSNQDSLDSLWDSSDGYTSSGSSLISFSFGVEFEQKYWQVRSGLHMKEYQSFKRVNDYDLSLPRIFLQTNQQASAVGGYVDYFFPLLEGLDVGIGLDLDQTTLKFSGDVMDDSDTSYLENAFSLESRGIVTSLRIPLRYNSYLNPIGTTVGITPLIPLALVGTSTSASANDTANGNLVPSVEDDLVNSLDFRAASFALEVVVGLYLSL